MTRPVLVIGYLAFIVISFLYWDKPLADYFHHLDLKGNASILNLITNIGLGALYFVSLPLLALYFRYRRQNRVWEARAWFLLLCLLISNMVCAVIKVSVGRARPELLFTENLYGFFGPHTQSCYWSFPSGHTTTVMSLTLGLGVLFPRYFYAFLTSGILLASLRIVLTHHYLSDVLTASYLVLLELGFLMYWLRRKNLLICNASIV